MVKGAVWELHATFVGNYSVWSACDLRRVVGCFPAGLEYAERMTPEITDPRFQKIAEEIAADPANA